MARPIAGEAPAPLPPSPFNAPPPLVAPAGGSPFNYVNQPHMPAPAVPATPTPLGLWNAFRRRWVLGTFLGALVAAAAAVGVWSALPGGKHQVRALVKLKPRNPGLVAGSGEDFAEYRNRQRFLLKSRSLITQTLAEPAVSSLESVRTSDNAVQMVEDQLKVSIATDDILEVSMTGNDLDDMKVIVDHLVKRYTEDANRNDRDDRNDQQKKLVAMSESMRAEIDAQEKQIELMVRANGVGGAQDGETRSHLLAQRLATAEANYSAADHAMTRLQSTITVLKKYLDDREKAPLDEAILGQLVEADPIVKEAVKNVEAADARYKATLKIAEDPENEEVKKDAEALKAAKAILADVRKQAAVAQAGKARALAGAERAKQLTDLQIQYEVKKEERDKFRAERDALQKLMQNGNVVNWDVVRMRDTLKPQREALEKVNFTITQLRVADKVSGRTDLLGDVEKVPYNNQSRKIAMSGFGGGSAFFGVLLLVAFLEWRTRRVDGVDQVVTELGMRVIGTVPAFPNRANLKAAVEAGGANWRFVLNESINSARTMLLHTARTQSMQVVMVTSATQGEGKTSLASQLATSMATAGMRTLIVDCDLRNPSVQKLFELPLGPGVSEILRQEIDVADAVQATAVPNLWVVPAGHCSNATIAALAQGHPMETLFNRLRGQFDFIIVDSCPVLPVADALLIGQHVDGVVFSIMQDISQLPKVLTASEKMNQLNIPLIGAVVNGIKQDVYSYGYNYVKQLPA